MLSVRECISYMVAAQRGPRAARPRRNDAPRSTRNDTMLHLIISTCLYSDEPNGCGVVRDSALDKELRIWATKRQGDGANDAETEAINNAYRSPAILRIERMMRRLLREHGVLPPPRPRMRVDRLRFVGKQHPGPHQPGTLVDCDHAVVVPVDSSDG